MKAMTTLILLLLLCNIHLNARQPYHTTITVDDSQVTVGAPNLVDLQRDLKAINIKKNLPSYNPNSFTSLNFNVRGISAIGVFPENSTTLVVQLPQIGAVESFMGGTRDESIALFKDYIRDGGNRRKIFNAYARYSPIDPIAGNPNSLQSQMAQADYLLGHLAPQSGCDCTWLAQPVTNLYQTGLVGGRAFSDNFDTTIVSLPIRYSFSPDLKSAFILDVPLTYLRNGGASSIVGSFGIGYRIPVIRNWSLTPVLRVGSGGTLDLCTGGCFATVGLTSVFNYKIQHFVLSMTNYGGYFTNTNLWLTGVNFNYHLHNYIFKNGLSFATCEGITFLNRKLNFNASFVDSCFTRDRLFIEHYDEVSISAFTKNILPYFDYDCLTIGFTYQFGQKKYKGYYFNLAYQF